MDILYIILLYGQTLLILFRIAVFFTVFHIKQRVIEPFTEVIGIGTSSNDYQYTH